MKYCNENNILLELSDYETVREFMMVLKRIGAQKMIEDKYIENVWNVDWLLDKVNKIDKMNEDERNEILKLLLAEAGRVAEERRRGEYFMDKIENHANTLSPEDRKLFYKDLHERWNRVLREESKKLSRIILNP